MGTTNIVSESYKRQPKVSKWIWHRLCSFPCHHNKSSEQALTLALRFRLQVAASFRNGVGQRCMHLCFGRAEEQDVAHASAGIVCYFDPKDTIYIILFYNLPCNGSCLYSPKQVHALVLWLRRRARWRSCIGWYCLLRWARKKK